MTFPRNLDSLLFRDLILYLNTEYMWQPLPFIPSITPSISLDLSEVFLYFSSVTPDEWCCYRP